MDDQHLFPQMNLVNSVPRRVNFEFTTVMLSGNSVTFWKALTAFVTASNF